MTITPLERPRAVEVYTFPTTIAPPRQEAGPTGTPDATSSPLTQPATIARIGLQAALGYEWLISGLDKVLYGRFPESLGDLLTGVLRGGIVPTPFAALLRVVALPYSALFGWLIEWSETLAGLAFLGAALAALLRPALERRLAPEARQRLALAQRVVDALALAAAAGTVLLGLSFYLLDGAPSFLPAPSIAFGGAIDTGLLLAALAAPLALGPAVRPALARLRHRSSNRQ